MRWRGAACGPARDLSEPVRPRGRRPMRAVAGPDVTRRERLIMSTTTTATPAPETQAPPLTVTEKAAAEVKRIIAEQQAAGGMPEKIYLRLRVVGGGCSGFQHKLDLDPQVSEKLDQVFDAHGVPVVVDKRSL